VGTRAVIAFFPVWYNSSCGCWPRGTGDYQALRGIIMKVRFAALMLANVAFGCSAVAATPSAESLITKCLSGYDESSTYQGTVTVRMERGSQKNKMVMTIKALNDRKGTAGRSFMSIVTQMAAGDTSTRETHTQFFDDGTNLFAVDLDAKQYSKQPHSTDRLSGLFRASFENARKFGGKLSVVETKVTGKPVYRITGKPKEGSVLIVIDQEKYRLRSVAASWGAGANKVSSRMTLENQVFNKPIAEGAFKWEPPAQFKEVPIGGRASP
jgi:outer membrane lipoprotein-sorting protein